jgi:hypothetical protein
MSDTKETCEITGFDMHESGVKALKFKLRRAEGQVLALKEALSMAKSTIKYLGKSTEEVYPDDLQAWSEETLKTIDRIMARGPF